MRKILRTYRNRQRFRWGILGTGRINAFSIPAIRTIEGQTVEAIAGRSKHHAGEFSRKWGIPKFYSPYEELLRDREIDAVYITLPNGLHAEWTLRSLKAGKHVLCEKPLVLSPRELDAIQTLTERMKLHVAEGFMYRHHPQTKSVKELIENGAIGTPQSIRGRFAFTPMKKDARFDPALGGGCLWDAGCYLVDYTRYLAQEEPTAVNGRWVLDESGVDVQFDFWLKFADGLKATLSCAYNAPLECWLEIAGNRGRLLVPSPIKPSFKSPLELSDSSGETTFIDITETDHYAPQFDNFQAVVSGAKPPVISLAHSRGNAATLCCLRQSAGLGIEVVFNPYIEE